MIEFCGNCQIGAINHQDEPGTCGHYNKCDDRHCSNWKRLHYFSTRERVVYICSPLRGNIQENIQRAKEYCRAACKSGAIPIAPHVYLTLFLDDNIPEERRAGMEMGMSLLERCDELWVFGEPSAGMRAEIQRAKELSRPINYIPIQTVNELNDRSKINEY